MWVLDLDQYNEWMTEEDYEVDEGGHKKIHKVGRTDQCNFSESRLVVLGTLLPMYKVIHDICCEILLYK